MQPYNGNLHLSNNILYCISVADGIDQCQQGEPGAPGTPGLPGRDGFPGEMGEKGNTILKLLLSNALYPEACVCEEAEQVRLDPEKVQLKLVKQIVHGHGRCLLNLW